MTYNSWADGRIRSGRPVAAGTSTRRRRPVPAGVRAGSPSNEPVEPSRGSPASPSRGSRDHGQQSFDALTTLQVDDQTFQIYRLDALKAAGLDVTRLPFSLKILLENLLRHEDGHTVTADDIKAWRTGTQGDPDREIAFRPSRVLLQDFTGVPAVVDLAAMRDAMKRMGGDPRKINPLQPVELVIDHSVQVDEAGTPQAFLTNAELEFSRNRERYAFLRWGQNAFENFRVVPPDTGIVHQVNLEYLARVVFTSPT